MNEDAVRPGEELNVPNVDAWLKTQIPDLKARPTITQFSGGASNWTYRLQYESHDLILRRPPAGTKAKSAHDMGREFRLQRALKPVFPYVPDDDRALRGRVGDRRGVLRHGTARRDHSARASSAWICRRRKCASSV